MKIKYISWNYGEKYVTEDGFSRKTSLHLIRLNDGRGLLRTSKEMVALGLAEYTFPKRVQSGF